MVSKKQTTLDDIARELKISKVAVSKALRDHPDISTKTKQLVQDMANKMGYVPNFIARNLSAKQSNTIGLVVPKIAHHFFATAIESIYETAYKNNIEIIMTVSQENSTHESKQIQTLMSMRVDGLLVSVTEETKDTTIFNTVAERNLPLVFFDRIIEGLGFDCVTSDDFESSRQTIVRMINGGYTKIAHLAGYSNTYIGQKRMSGFKKAFEEKNMQVPPEWIIEGGFSEEDGYHGFSKLVKTGHLPEVIFAVTYPVALGVLLAAEQLGVNIPGEVELLTFGGSDYNRFMKPSLTYIDQPAEQIGKVATELLLEQIRFPKNETGKFIEIPTELVFCETCKKF